MQLTCPQIVSELSAIQKLKADFDATLHSSAESQNIAQLNAVYTIQQELEVKIMALRQSLWLFSELPRETLRKKYDSEIQILTQNGLLETFPTGEQGITGIDGVEYPFPTFSQITKQLQARPELREKMQQGFTQLQITPFALPLQKLTDTVSEAILRHKKANQLFATKLNQDDPNEPLILLELDEANPLNVRGSYVNADISGGLVYFPLKFDPENHQGQTKQQLLQTKLTFPGFFITLTESNQNIPAGNKDQTQGGRKQPEDNQAPNDYLRQLQTQSHQHERGLTPEEWLIRFLQHLEQTNQVIDDYQGHGKYCYNLAGYFPASGNVSGASWVRLGQRADLNWNGVDFWGLNNNARSVVSV
ncbi:hypothetical protein EPO05_01340 [Patescibacteria group bacterium]|nr:MAG: hypothetical protein EPO05_01340 [Patescibacteria group bacterium]